MRRSLVLLVAAGVLAFMAMAGVASAHTVKFDSVVTIQKHKNGTDPDSLTGRVISDKPRCERNRTIEVFQRVDGPDLQVGTTTTNADGEWEFAFAGDAPEGTYYAVATRKVLRSDENHRHVCRRAVSNDVTFH